VFISGWKFSDFEGKSLLREFVESEDERP
jgi:hypothetical protein